MTSFAKDAFKPKSRVCVDGMWQMDLLSSPFQSLFYFVGYLLAQDEYGFVFIVISQNEEKRTLELGGHVGFDSLPDQLVSKASAQGFCFNILCVGMSEPRRSFKLSPVTITRVQIHMHSFCFICNFRSLFFCLFLRWDRDRQVHIDEHSFQYNIWKWGSQPLWANGGAAPTHVWTAGEQCQPQADCCTHCRVWRPDQQRTEVQVADGCDDGLLVKMTFILFFKEEETV